MREPRTDRPSNLAGSEVTTATDGGLVQIAKGDVEWRTLASLVHDPHQLDARIDAVRTDLASRAGIAQANVPMPVAASLTQLGLAVRLVQPVVRLALTAGVVPRLTLEDLWWRGELYNPAPLGFTTLTGRRPADCEDVARALLADAIDPVLDPLGAAVIRARRVSPQVLRGNTVAAIAAAARSFDRVAGHGGPGPTRHGERLVQTVLTARSDPRASHLAPNGNFERDTCCLIYRVPGAGFCADCPLRHSRQHPS